MKKIEKESNL